MISCSLPLTKHELGRSPTSQPQPQPSAFTATTPTCRKRLPTSHLQRKLHDAFLQQIVRGALNQEYKERKGRERKGYLRTLRCVGGFRGRASEGYLCAPPAASRQPSSKAPTTTTPSHLLQSSRSQVEDSFASQAQRDICCVETCRPFVASHSFLRHRQRVRDSTSTSTYLHQPTQRQRTQ